MNTYEHFNSADMLPPVDCPLIVDLGSHYGMQPHPARVTRTTHLSNRNGQMEYRLSSGKVIVGRFRWTYP